MATDKKTYEEIITDIREEMEMYVDTMEKSCQYKSSSDRFCRATSQRSCMGCRFFMPTMHHLIEYVYDKRKEAEHKLKEKDKKIASLKETVRQLEDIVDDLREKTVV